VGCTQTGRRLASPAVLLVVSRAACNRWVAAQAHNEPSSHTLGNILANGVRSLDVSCHRRAILSADPWPDENGSSGWNDGCSDDRRRAVIAAGQLQEWSPLLLSGRSAAIMENLVDDAGKSISFWPNGTRSLA
jgi:hypothetical protein